MAVATKSVVGNIGNISAGDIAGMTMLFDLDPQWVVVDNTIIVGVQTGGVKGEPVTPDPDTGAFTVDLVAVDDPTWTITVTISGPTVENPIVISIAPPPAAGTGDVNFEDLIVPASTPGSPVVIVGPGGGGGAVASVNGHTGIVNLTYSDVGGLPSSYTPPAAPVTSVAGRTGAITLVAADVSGALTQTTADARYLQDTTGALARLLAGVEPVIYRDETAGTWPLRATVLSDLTKPALWSGTVAPATTTGFAVAGVDFFRKKPA